MFLKQNAYGLKSLRLGIEGRFVGMRICGETVGEQARHSMPRRSAGCTTFKQK